MKSSFLDQVGDCYGSFVVTKALWIEELSCELREITHTPTGAQVMHIAADDPENLFCLSFRTYPKSSNGAPHILEHVVLCGSEKFPVKDPFFAMTRRSLNTYMNALTGNDFTCYPASSQVEKDFYNLLDVYLDAVFHPNLRRVSFLQEGWRLEFATADDPKSPLEYKGIVYNEMKGSLASADARLWHALLRTLCPDLPYAHTSGGEPDVIPQLTYEELSLFHRTYYHPSHCLFFFYGNLPLKQHLDFIAKRVLAQASPSEPLPPMPLQKRWSAPKREEIPYPAQEERNKALIAFGFLTAPLTEQEEVLAISLLASVLLETDASPLKRALLDSGLCTQVEVGLDREMSEVPFAIVCKGCDLENADALERVLEKALEQSVREGIPRHLVDAALHQLEFSRTEIGADHVPFGLTLFFRAALGKQHGCAPEHALMIHALFEQLAVHLSTPNYLPRLIEKYLLKNPHRVRLALRPDLTLVAQEGAKERKVLDRIAKSLSASAVKEILAEAKELAKMQQESAHPNLDCLPKVTLDDVSLRTPPLALKHHTAAAVSVFHHPCFTNKVLYADLLFDLPYIAAPDLPFIQLFVSLLTEVGCKGRTFAQNLEYMQLYTGGVGSSISLHVQTDDPLQSRPTLAIRGKALERHAPQLLSLFCEIAQFVRFDEEERIEQLILQLATGLQSRLTQNALKYAAYLALSGFSPPLHLNEVWDGFSYFCWVQELAKNIKQQLPMLLEKLQKIQGQLLCSSPPQIVIGSDPQFYQQLEKEEFYGLTSLPFHTEEPWWGGYDVSAVISQARPIALPVAFMAEAFKTISFLHPHAPALSVAAELCDNTVLHRKVREEGGAYGTGATYRAQNGAFYLYSYRDPHIAPTVRTFSAAIESVARGDFSAVDLEQAKLGVIQQWDSPIAPDARAGVAYSRLRQGKTTERLQRSRERLLAVSSSEVKQIVEQELLSRKNFSTLVCCAGNELLAREPLDPPLPVIPF